MVGRRRPSPFATAAWPVFSSTGFGALRKTGRRPTTAVLMAGFSGFTGAQRSAAGPSGGRADSDTRPSVNSGPGCAGRAPPPVSGSAGRAPPSAPADRRNDWAGFRRASAVGAGEFPKVARGAGGAVKRRRARPMGRVPLLTFCRGRGRSTGASGSPRGTVSGEASRESTKSRRRPWAPGLESRAVGVELELEVRRRAVAGGAPAVVDGPSRPPPSGAMLGGGRFAGTVLGAGRARGFGAGTEPGGGLEGGPRGLGTGWSGNLIASGALTGTTFGDVCGCSTTTCVEIKFYGAFPRHRCDACTRHTG